MKNQLLSYNVSRDSAMQIAEHLRNSTFYLGFLDPKTYPKDWTEDHCAKFGNALGRELRGLTEHLFKSLDTAELKTVKPDYSFDSLALAVQEASTSFHNTWEGILGKRHVEGVSSVKWQSIKAMSHHYAEGRLNTFRLRPIDTLVTQTRNVLTRFLEKPLGWEPEALQVEEGEKIAVINRLKQIVNEKLEVLSKNRLWETAVKDWQRAYEPRGTGSTKIRKQRVADIFTHQIPIPRSVSDSSAQDWIDQIKDLLLKALRDLEQELNG